MVLAYGKVPKGFDDPEVQAVNRYVPELNRPRCISAPDPKSYPLPVTYARLQVSNALGRISAPRSLEGGRLSLVEVRV